MIGAFLAAHGRRSPENGITMHYRRGDDCSRALLVGVGSLLIAPEPGSRIAISQYGLWWSIAPSEHHIGEICIEKRSLEAAPQKNTGLLIRIKLLIIQENPMSDWHTLFVTPRAPPIEIPMPEEGGTYAIHQPSGIPLLPEGGATATLHRGKNPYGGPILKDDGGNVFLDKKVGEPISSIMR